ncbi:MAG: redox-sensitive transcriptional activator SoxR [Gammaproteobacteria bacterium]
MTRNKAKKKTRSELTVGEVAARSGLAVSAIQFYESKGLIVGTRTAGRRRLYGSDVLPRVAVIKTAQSVGIPLSAMRDILTLLPTERVPSRDDWNIFLDTWRSDVDKRVARLHSLRAELLKCETCGCLSAETCPLLAAENAHET